MSLANLTKHAQELLRPLLKARFATVRRGPAERVHGFHKLRCKRWKH
jgi:hypothetical protein